MHQRTIANNKIRNLNLFIYFFLKNGLTIFDLNKGKLISFFSVFPKFSLLNKLKTNFVPGVTSQHFLRPCDKWKRNIKTCYFGIRVLQNLAQHRKCSIFYHSTLYVHFHWACDLPEIKIDIPNVRLHWKSKHAYCRYRIGSVLFPLLKRQYHEIFWHFFFINPTHLGPW